MNSNETDSLIVPTSVDSCSTKYIQRTRISIMNMQLAQLSSECNEHGSVYQDAVETPPSHHLKTAVVNETVTLGAHAADATMNLGPVPGDATFCTNPAQTTFQVAPGQTTFVMDAVNPNATVTLNKNSGALSDATFDIHSSNNEKEDNNAGQRSFETAKDSSVPHNDTIITEDESYEPLPPLPVKQNAPLFSLVKMRIEAFEKAAAAAATEQPKRPLSNKKENVLMKQQQQMSARQKMMPPPPKTASKYTFEMLHENDSTDDEDKVSYKRPPPPTWSRRHIRGPNVLKQELIPSGYIESFFSVQPMTPDLKQIFPNIDARPLKRNSNVFWSTPPRYSELPKY